MPDIHRLFRSEVDAGWAWVVSAAAFAVQFVVFGTIQSYGTIFSSLMKEFNTDETTTSWVGALAYGLLFLNSPVTTALCEHFGCRAVTCAGSILCMTGLILTSYVTKISTMFFTFSILWGIGASFAFFPSMLALRFFFDRKMSQANGLSMSGAGVGTLVMNIVLQDIDDRYGWRGCMRVLGGLTAVLFICGCMFRPPPADFYGANQWSEWSKKVGFLTKLRRMFDPRPWKVKGFTMWVLAHSTILFAYFVPYVHLVNMANSLGISRSDGALLVGYLSIAAIFGKLLCGRLADFPKVKPLYLLVGSALVLAASNMGVTAATNFDGLLTFVLIFGFFDGCFVVVVPQITQDIVGMPLVANALGCQYGLSALTLSLGPPMTGQIYKVTGSYNAAFFAGSALMFVGIFLLYFVQRLRPDLTASKPWPEPITGQQRNSTLIPGPSIESLISGLDTLSGLCVTKPLPVHLSPGQMELGDYHRFGHNETEPKLEFAAHQSHGESGPYEVEVTVDVTSVTLECASLEIENADHRSFSRDSTGPAISLDTSDHSSSISVSRDPVVSEVLAVPSRDADSVLSGSVLSYTGNISMSGTYLEGCSVSDSARSERPGNYEVRSNISTDASIAGIAGEMESRGSDYIPWSISKEGPDILVDVSSSETSAVAIDVQSLVSWESADRGEHKVPETGSDIEIIKLPPPPSSTKQNLTPSLITLETSVDEDTAHSIEHTVNSELQTSQCPDAGRDATVDVPEGNEKLIMIANDMPHNLIVASGNLTRKEGRQGETLNICMGEPRQISEDLACHLLSNVDDVGQIWKSMTQSHLEDAVDVSITSESTSSRDGDLDTAFEGLAKPLPPQEQWLLETEMQVLRGGTETTSRSDGIDMGSVDVSHLSSSDTPILLMDETGAMTAVASEEQCLPATVVADITQQLITVCPCEIQAKQCMGTSSGPVPHESAKVESSLDEKEQPTAEEELVRLPPPPRAPRTGTLIVVQDADPLDSFTAEVGVAGAEAFVRHVLEECVDNEPRKDLKTTTSIETICTTSTISADPVLTEKDSFIQENDAFVANQAAPTTLAATVDVEYVQLPPPPAIPRIGTLIPLEEHENERIHQTDIDNHERGSETLLNTESDSALILLNVSPKQSTTPLSPGLLSIEEDPLTTRQSIGVFHRSVPRFHTSINEPSQLSLLSQRLEAMAARQFEEEQSELITSTNDGVALVVSTNQSALSTPLFSANHSVPLTPMRVFSSYLVTPVLSAAQTPYNVPFSSTDASIIQTPVDASFLHSPVESGTADSDIHLEFGFEPSSHALFTEDTFTERGADGSYSHPWNTPTQTRTSSWNTDNPGIADAQAQPVSGAVSAGNQRDTDCSGMVRGLEERKSTPELFNSQAQDPNAAQTVAQSTNPFHFESAEDVATSNSTENGLLTSLPPAEQFWNTAAADADKYDGQPLKSTSLVENVEGNTDKEQVVAQDLNSLFSSNPFEPATLSEATTSSNAQSLSDPWCPHPDLLSPQHPVEACIKLYPHPLISRRKRTASDNQECTEEDRGQDILAHFPICEESKDQVLQLETCEVQKDDISMYEDEGQEPPSRQPTNTSSPIHDVKAARELFPLQCEKIPEATNHLSAEGNTNLDDINATNPLHEVICAGDVPLTIEDATNISNSDNGVKQVDNLPAQSYDEVTSHSNNVTIQPNGDIIQGLNYMLMKHDDASNKSESQLTTEMQSDDYATMNTDESMSHRRTEPSTKIGDEVTSRLDDVISQITEHQCHDDDTASLLHTKEERFCFVTVEDGELERTSSTSSVATDESSSMDTSLSENEMPYRKLQGENSSCEH